MFLNGKCGLRLLCVMDAAGMCIWGACVEEGRAVVIPGLT